MPNQNTDQQLKDAILRVPDGPEADPGKKFLLLMLDRHGVKKTTQMLDRLDTALNARDVLERPDFHAYEWELARIATASSISRRGAITRVLIGLTLMGDGIRDADKVREPSGDGKRAPKFLGHASEIVLGGWIIRDLSKEQDYQRLVQITEAVSACIHLVNASSVSQSRGSK